MKNKNPEVNQYLAKKAHPLTTEIERLRDIILATDARIEETIKWSAPTFMYKGNMASYFMNAKKHVSLMFHTGASLPNKSGLLQGTAKEGRTMKFKTIQEIEDSKDRIEEVVREWIGFRDEQE